MRISKKGITPVIAMILLILIVVALGGVFAAWTTRTWESVQEKGTEQIEQTTESFRKGVIIDNIDCGTGDVYVRNTGSVDLPTSEISVYVGDSLKSVTWSPDPIPAGQVSTASTGGAITETVRISVGTGIQDSSNKCVP